VFGDELFEGTVTFIPPFPMTHWDNSSGGLPIIGLTYGAKVQGTNGAAQVTFIGTDSLWFAANPASVTNSGTSINELKKLIDANYIKELAGTNIVEQIIKFQGQDAIEISGNINTLGIGDNISGSLHDQIIMYWIKTQDWRRNTVFMIDAQAQNNEVCKTLIKAVTIHPPKN
jgi:hypothetical protein